MSRTQPTIQESETNSVSVARSLLSTPVEKWTSEPAWTHHATVREQNDLDQVAQ